MKSSISWKGQTITQIASSIKKNTTSAIISENNIRLSQPLKLYRREISLSSHSSPSVQRTGIKIEHLNMPGGRGTTELTTIPESALFFVADATDSNTNVTATQYCENYSNEETCMASQSNALSRVRSSGLLRKKYNVDKNNEVSYHTNSKQYLESRNKTFNQNQFNYLKYGNSTVKPGDPLSGGNLYAPIGITHCESYVDEVSGETVSPYTQIYYKPKNHQFATQGAVSAGALITRKKFNAISTNALNFKTAYGNSVANAMAYSGDTSRRYTIKDKIGTTMPNVPIVKADGSVTKSCFTRIRR